MRGVTMAWFAGLGLITWRSFKQTRKPPVPGQLLGASGAFALLALLAEYQPAAGAAALLAWGLDVAALLQVLPDMLQGTNYAQAEQAGASSAWRVGEAAQG